MNTERLAILRDHISMLPDPRFSMAFHGRYLDSEDIIIGLELEENCGTAGCLCGWTNALFNPDKPCADEHSAAAALGLSGQQAWNLFYAKGHRFGELEDIPLWAAVKVLDHAVNERQINWGVA